MSEYKGIYYNDKKEHRYYEGGAHFKYSALVKVLSYLSESKDFSHNNHQPNQNDDNFPKPKTRNIISFANNISVKSNIHKSEGIKTNLFLKNNKNSSNVPSYHRKNHSMEKKYQEFDNKKNDPSSDIINNHTISLHKYTNLNNSSSGGNVLLFSVHSRNQKKAYNQMKSVDFDNNKNSQLWMNQTELKMKQQKQNPIVLMQTYHLNDDKNSDIGVKGNNSGGRYDKVNLLRSSNGNSSVPKRKLGYNFELVSQNNMNLYLKKRIGDFYFKNAYKWINNRGISGEKKNVNVNNNNNINISLKQKVGVNAFDIYYK